MTTEKELNEKIYVYDSVVNSLLNKLRSSISYPKKPHKDYYEYIPMNTSVVVDELLVARQYFDYRREYTRFLDVGCGIGNIMVIASSCGLVPSGIEYDSDLLKYGLHNSKSLDDVEKLRTHYNKLRLKAKTNDYPFYEPVHSMNHCIINCDAFNFPYYNEFDIVYTYHPIRNNELELRLEKLIEDNLKVGAIFICNAKLDWGLEDGKQFKRVYSKYPMWKKIKK